jgi:hypothetical protein
MPIGNGGIKIVNKKTRTKEAYKYASNGSVDVLIDTTITEAHWGKTINCYNTITLYITDLLPVGFWCVIRDKDGNLKTITVFGSRQYKGAGNTLATENKSALLEVCKADALGIGEYHYGEGFD